MSVMTGKHNKIPGADLTLEDFNDVPPQQLFPGQDENGVDVTLLIENLKRTPLERLLRLQEAANSILMLRAAKKRGPT